MPFGFWGKIKKPIMSLAPMADVTDAAFRRIIAKYGKPDVMFTEFVSADGIICADKTGREKLMEDLLYTDAERPIVAQFFTARPEMMKKAALLAVKLGFDGVDINMGCPDRSVEKQSAGAALMKNPMLAREIIVAAREGAPRLPISVKTRIGYSKNEIETWLPELLAEKPAVITFHARTRKEMSKVPARWDIIKRAVQIRDEAGSKTFILGNGDVRGLEDARKKVKEIGVDGIMLGRAIFGSPWLFSSSQEFENKCDMLVVEKILAIMVEHTELFEKLFGKVKNFAVMKKHYKAYASGFIGARELRAKLMETKNIKEVKNIVDEFLKTKNTSRYLSP